MRSPVPIQQTSIAGVRPIPLAPVVRAIRVAHSRRVPVLRSWTINGFQRNHPVSVLEYVEQQPIALTHTLTHARCSLVAIAISA
jgi:hypothetical protein